MPEPKRTARRRLSLQPAHKICLSCQHSDISTERGQLRVLCNRGHERAEGDCRDYCDAGTSALLAAIARRIEDTQQAYRVRFNEIHPDCFGCVQNCCTTPFLSRTPFYPEDALYYILRDQPLPHVPKGLKHCMFFNRGCTLPVDLRPHVCIEYKCIYQDDARINALGQIINYATIDLLAVATRDYSGWRGQYTVADRASLKRKGLPADRIYDRFDREWDPQDPIGDLLVLYQVSGGERPARA